MKLGLDLHGVITHNPVFFSELSKLFLRNNWEIHLITGSKITEELKAVLHAYKIHCSAFFSISDYCKKEGVSVRYDDKGNPWLDEDVWDRTKAEYCEREKIDFHIDDSEKYGEFFVTPYCVFKPTLARFCWFFKDICSGGFMYNSPDAVYKNIEDVIKKIEALRLNKK